jgi:hypothetical protein
MTKPKTTTTTRGGKRPNSGRKLGVKNPVNLLEKSVKISEKSYKIIQENAKKQSISIKKMIDYLASLIDVDVIKSNL